MRCHSKCLYPSDKGDFSHLDKASQVVIARRRGAEREFSRRRCSKQLLPLALQMPSGGTPNACSGRTPALGPASAARPERTLARFGLEAGHDPLQSVAHIPENSHSPLQRQCIQRAGRAARRHLEHMGVDHGGAHVRVPQQFLHRADVRARLQQMRREGMAQGVHGDGLGNPPASATAFLMARWSRSSNKWWRRSTPVAGSTDRVGDGKTQNHPHRCPRLGSF